MRGLERIAKQGFLAKHRITRSAIREDLLCFALPALLVYVAGLAVSAVDGWVGIVETAGNLISHPRSLTMLPAEYIAGLALVVTGLAVLFVGTGTLGRSYSSFVVIKEGHRLVTHGIYRFTRRPIYLGAIMVCIGLPVYASSWVGVLIMSALIPLFLYRIRLEERLLTEEYGDAYRGYSEATRELIPFIY